MKACNSLVDARGMGEEGKERERKQKEHRVDDRHCGMTMRGKYLCCHALQATFQTRFERGMEQAARGDQGCQAVQVNALQELFCHMFRHLIPAHEACPVVYCACTLLHYVSDHS